MNSYYRIWKCSIDLRETSILSLLCFFLFRFDVVCFCCSSRRKRLQNRIMYRMAGRSPNRLWPPFDITNSNTYSVCFIITLHVCHSRRATPIPKNDAHVMLMNCSIRKLNRMVMGDMKANNTNNHPEEWEQSARRSSRRSSCFETVYMITWFYSILQHAYSIGCIHLGKQQCARVLSNGGRLGIAWCKHEATLGFHNAFSFAPILKIWVFPCVPKQHIYYTFVFYACSMHTTKVSEIKLKESCLEFG